MQFFEVSLSFFLFLPIRYHRNPHKSRLKSDRLSEEYQKSLLAKDLTQGSASAIIARLQGFEEGIVLWLVLADISGWKKTSSPASCTSADAFSACVGKHF